MHSMQQFERILIDFYCALQFARGLSLDSRVHAVQPQIERILLKQRFTDWFALRRLLQSLCDQHHWAQLWNLHRFGSIMNLHWPQHIQCETKRRFIIPFRLRVRFQMHIQSVTFTQKRKPQCQWTSAASVHRIDKLLPKFTELQICRYCRREQVCWLTDRLIIDSKSLHSTILGTKCTTNSIDYCSSIHKSEPNKLLVLNSVAHWLK